VREVHIGRTVIQRWPLAKAGHPIYKNNIKKGWRHVSSGRVSSKCKALNSNPSDAPFTSAFYELLPSGDSDVNTPYNHLLGSIIVIFDMRLMKEEDNLTITCQHPKILVLVNNN
jgi:hypothetical protein